VTGYTLEGDTLRVTAAGSATARELCDAFRVALDHAVLPAKPGVLLDLGGAPRISLGEGDLRLLCAIAAEAKLPSLGARVAWFAPSDLGYGTGRVFQSLASLLPLEVEVFREIEAAERWLGLPQPRSAVRPGGAH
jgi:hypothetical protein